jgi:hypothetical protein
MPAGGKSDHDMPAYITKYASLKGEDSAGLLKDIKSDGWSDAQAQHIANSIKGVSGSPTKPAAAQPKKPAAAPTKPIPSDDWSSVDQARVKNSSPYGHGTHGMGRAPDIAGALKWLEGMLNKGAQNTVSVPAGANVAQNDKNVVGDAASAAARAAAGAAHAIGSGLARGSNPSAPGNTPAQMALPIVVRELKNGTPAQAIISEMVTKHGFSYAEAQSVVAMAMQQVRPRK